MSLSSILLSGLLKIHSFTFINRISIIDRTVTKGNFSLSGIKYFDLIKIIKTFGILRISPGIWYIFLRDDFVNKCKYTQSIQYLSREKLRGEWSELSAENFYNLPRILIALFFSTRVATVFFRRPIYFSLSYCDLSHSTSLQKVICTPADRIFRTFIAKQLPGLDKSYITVSDTIKLWNGKRSILIRYKG